MAGKQKDFHPKGSKLQSWQVLAHRILTPRNLPQPYPFGAALVCQPNSSGPTKPDSEHTPCSAKSRCQAKQTCLALSPNHPCFALTMARSHLASSEVQF